MAPQDYVSRPRSAKKKNNPYQAKAKQAKPGIDIKISLKIKLISFFTLLAVSLFVYSLWALKEKAPVTAKVAVPAQPVHSQPENALPEVPAEKWAYMQELKTKQVEVSKYEVENKGPYKLQCASFRTQKQAESLKAKIAFAGLEAQIKSAKGEKRTYYKVFLGPYPRKRLAEKDKHQLANNKVNTCQIWLWR
jgi:cell division protein FtsN